MLSCFTCVRASCWTAVAHCQYYWQFCLSMLLPTIFYWCLMNVKVGKTSNNYQVCQHFITLPLYILYSNLIIPWWIIFYFTSSRAILGMRFLHIILSLMKHCACVRIMLHAFRSWAISKFVIKSRDVTCQVFLKKT